MCGAIANVSFSQLNYYLSSDEVEVMSVAEKTNIRVELLTGSPGQFERNSVFFFSEVTEVPADS